MKKKEPVSKLRRLNALLSILVVLLALYIMISPLLPNVGYWVSKANPNKPVLVQAQENPSSNDETIPDENTLVIPKLVMQQHVFEGSSATVLSKGIWHRPKTSTPDQGGNTVLVGHRFTYKDPAVFYHLDKVASGDEIVLYWEKTKYTYVVSHVFVVPAIAIEVEAASEEPILTLYTCTPLWTAKDRLVVRAKLKENI